jgi:hypothetical protein
VNPHALHAARTSIPALTELLSQTHTCLAAVRPDGTIDDGALPFTVEAPDEMVNTLWVPRRSVLSRLC